MATGHSSDSSAKRLLDLVGGHRVTAVLYVAASLGIADLLRDGPKSVSELARLTDAHERSLLRLMRALVKLAICTEVSDGRFELTEMGTHLAANSERSLKAWVLFEGGGLQAAWSEMIESIRTGKTATELAGLGQERFEVMAKTKEAGLFNEAMVSLTRMAVPDVLSAYDFSGISTLMDVGGGLGELMCAILKEYPSMRGIIFDLPHCAEGARRNLSDAEVADRCEFIGGSFFESVPSGADAIVMKSIIHDWNDERCVRVLQNCHRVLTPGARLMLIDKVLPEKIEPGGDDLFVFLDDLNMLRGPGGCERTPSEFRALLAKGSFSMKQVVPAGRYSVIEAAAE
jgi:O-methyltransferase domain/Dimerisation domain